MSSEVEAYRPLAEELDRIDEEAIASGVEAMNEVNRLGNLAMLRKGRAVLERYPDLGSDTPPGGSEVSYVKVAIEAGRTDKTIKKWVDLVRRVAPKIEDRTDEVFEAAAIELARKQTDKWVAKMMPAEPVAIAEPEMPPGEYNLIYADPPWEYRNSGFAMSAAQHYPTMATDEICAMQIPASDNAVCFMWVTNPLLEDGLSVLSAWGFEYKTCMVWVKDRHTAGFYVFGQHELLLIGVKGSGMTPLDEGKPKSVVYGDNSEHSRKPDEVYSIIEAMYPATKKLELFARRTRDGWEPFGNEI